MNVDALFASPWGALVIFFLRIIDVSCDTMRVIFAIRGKRAIAAGIGIAAALRAQGYGVTESQGVGRDGAVEVLNSVVQRRHLDDVLSLVTTMDGEAFVTVEEPRVLLGGSIATREWAVGGPLGRWMRLRQRA